MAFEIKSGKTFKFVIGASALFISTMAAVFSVTGVATLFSGYFLTVAFMMGGLEFGKVVVASFMARYWKKLNYLFRFYFILALMVLISITSGGIFGYLSDGYQKTKGTYDVSEKEVVFLNQKIDIFTAQKKQADDRIAQISSARKGQEARLDSLYSRRQVSSAKSVESYITKASKDVEDLTTKSNTYADSLSKYSMKKLEKENINATGELGPLKYLAKIFNTDMDSIVKYFIFMLIFVFDPLAILLFVSLNIIIKNEGEETPDVVHTDGFFSKAGKKLFNKIKPNKEKPEEIIEPSVEINTVVVSDNKLIEPHIDEISVDEEYDEHIVDTEFDEQFAKTLLTVEPTGEIIEEPLQVTIESSEVEPVKTVDEVSTDINIVNTEDEIEIPEIESTIINIDTDNSTIQQEETPKTDDIAHDFYHGEDPTSPAHLDWHSSNLPKQAIHNVANLKIKKPTDESDTKVY